MRGRYWPEQTRRELARAVVERGVSARELSARLGVPYQTALDWVQQYRKRGEEGLRNHPRSLPKAPSPR